MFLPLAAACSLSPEIQPHTPSLPQQWVLSGSKDTSATVPQTTVAWWQTYQDARLDRLVSKVLTQNTDIQLAAARVEEARAAAGLARAQQLPEISGEAGASRGNSSQAFTAPTQKPSGSLSAGGLLSYEIDLWGRLANSTKAATARLLSVEENARAVKIGATAEAVSNYFALASLNEQIALTHQTIKARQNTYSLEKRRLDKGDTDALSVSQSQSQLLAAQSRLPVLERQREQYLTALSILLGQTPAEVMASFPFTDTAEPKGPDALPLLPPLPEKTPENVLSSRPDIMAAEHTLQAANADIGVARAAYLPRISLSGLLGIQSSEMDNLFSGDSLWLAGANASVPLLDFGRARSQVDGAKAREKQAYLNYEKTVRTAFGEIKDALTVRQKSGEEYQALSKQAEVLQNAAQLARRRFESGYSGYIDVLDAERSLFDAQISQIEAKRLQLQASVDLYRALGEE